MQPEVLYKSSAFTAGPTTDTQWDQWQNWEQGSGLPPQAGSLPFLHAHLGTSGDPPWKARAVMSSAVGISGLGQWH